MKRITATVALIFFSQILLTAQATTLWRFKTTDRIYSSPVLIEDMVLIGSGDHHLYAVNKATGEMVWRFKTGGAVHSTPAVKDNMIFFSSADGNLYAVSKDDGKLIWTFASEGEVVNGLWDYYLSSPRFDDSLVYWGCGDGNLYAIQSLTGKIEWKFTAGDIIHASPVIHNNSVVVGCFDGYLYNINKQSGTLNWKFRTVGARYFPKGEIQKAVLVDNDVVYFGSRDYNIYAVDVNTGRGVWNMKQPSGWIIATPLEYRNHIYFGTSDAHLFYCMDKREGTVTWTIPLNMRVYGTAVARDDIVYFGTFDGKIIGVDYLTGDVKWEFQTPGSIENYHLIYNDKGEFRDGFELYGSNYLESEAQIHSLGSILSSPLIENRIIYFGSSDGYLYAVEL